MTGAKAHAAAVREKLPVILLISLLASVIAYALAERVEEKHSAFFTYTVSLSQREAASESQYAFDGYYALQATDMFAASLARWVQAPEMVVRAYEQSGLNLPGDDPRLVSRSVTATKTAPQVVEVRVEARSGEEAVRLSGAIRENVKRQIDKYHDEGIPALTFKAVATDPWVGVNEIGARAIAAAVFAAVFVLAVNAVLLTRVQRAE